LALGLAAAPAACARVWVVRQGGTPGKNCDATDLPDALRWEGVRPGDEIHVYPGVYGRLPAYGKSDFSGTVWKARHANGRDAVARADGVNPVVIDAHGQPQAVNFGGGRADGLVFQGFEIRGARGDGYAAGYGIWMTTRGVTIQDCYLHDCGRGAIFVSNHAVSNTIRRCVVRDGCLEESGMQGCGMNRFEDNRLLNGRVVIHDRVANGTVLTGNVAFDRAGEPVMPRLWANYYASADGVKGYYSLYGHGLAEGLEFTAEVADERGRTVARRDAPATTADGSLWIPVPGLRPGSYAARVALRQGKAREPLAALAIPFVHEEFPWEHNALGRGPLVVSPFDPIRVHNEDLYLWGRKVSVGVNGLPSQIVNQGVPMLAAPIALAATLDGRRVTLVARPAGYRVSDTEAPAVAVPGSGATWGPLAIARHDFRALTVTAEP
jgi:hypothetical protein